MGYIYYIQKNFDKAIEFSNKSLQLCEATRNFSLRASPLNNIGEVYISLNNYEEALVILKKSLQLRTIFYEKARPLTDIADVYFRQGKLAEALTTCEESLALSRTYGGRIQAGVTLHLMAKIRQQEQRPADALPYIQEAVTIFRETGSRHLADAERTLQAIQERMNEQENTS